jgi:deoxyribonuclease-4
VRIALENTAGQGTCLGYRLEHLAQIYDRVKHSERLGICLDTAHFFASGYDIRTEKGWNSVIQQVATLIGLKQVLAFHLNDSKTACGSRVDRHEHIGKGKIGLPAFRFIMGDRRFRKIPKVLETPKGKDLAEDVENMKMLRGLIKTAPHYLSASF